MQTFTATQAKTRFGELLDLTQRGPVRVTRHDRVVGVLVSARDYEAMRAFYADRLQHTLGHAATQAQAQGLTAGEMHALLVQLTAGNAQGRS
jgi:prevent-host-death family protein